MPLDPSIILQGKLPQIDGPMDVAAKAQQYQSIQQQNRLAELALSKNQQESDATNALNRLYQTATKADGTVDRTALYSGLAQGGMGSRIPAMQKQFADADKATADVGHVNAQTGELNNKVGTKQHEVIGQTLGSLAQIPNPTPQHVSNAVQHLVDIGVIQPPMAQKIIAGVPQDPSQIQGWLLQGQKAVMSVKDQTALTTPDANAVLSSKTQIAGQASTAATAAAGRAQSAQQFAMTQEAGKVPVGYRKNADGVSMSYIPGGPADPNAPGGKMSEDQGKASGWLIQAENAFKNMKASGFDAEGKPKSAAYPGFNDGLSTFPGMGGVANSLRSPDRQKFIQSSSSLSEALLRAATGAGVNESEAKQKIEELTPQFGEDESTTKQKMDAIPLYIESLKLRAGPGANKAEKVIQAQPAAQPAPQAPDRAGIIAELRRRGVMK